MNELKNCAKIIKSCSTFLFDCDGVIWRSNTLLQSADLLIKYLSETNKNVFLITNNSRYSVKDYVAKCSRLGLTVTESNIICTANVAAQYVRKNTDPGLVYVIGEKGIGDEFENIGLLYTGIGPEIGPNPQNPLEGVELQPNVKTVLVGYDSHFNYRKLMKATSFINDGAVFIATNEDFQLPTKPVAMPGTGSIVAAVQYAVQKKPIVLGKPHKPMFDLLNSLCNIKLDETIMIGDNLHTDIAFGNKFGMHTACVLSGVTTRQMIDDLNRSDQNPDLKPDFVFESVTDIYNILKSEC